MSLSSPQRRLGLVGGLVLVGIFGSLVEGAAELLFTVVVAALLPVEHFDEICILDLSWKLSGNV